MEPGTVLSHTEMCAREGKNLQAGMHFDIAPTHSVVLMSTRPGAPYADVLEENGEVLIYEGHDVPRGPNVPDPKSVDQPLFTRKGTITQNGRFYHAAEGARNGERHPARVRVYEKVRPGVWVYNGTFLLVDAWQEESGGRLVCKFKLRATDSADATATPRQSELEHIRMIPSEVKRRVWARDRGRCTQCGSTDNLHFDHVIPYSRGGSSLTAQNIQLLCARHNLQKRDRIV